MRGQGGPQTGHPKTYPDYKTPGRSRDEFHSDEVHQREEPTCYYLTHQQKNKVRVFVRGDKTERAGSGGESGDEESVTARQTPGEDGAEEETGEIATGREEDERGDWDS